MTTLRGLGIAELFQAVVCAEDYINGKPAPDPFLEAARRLGVPPEQCLVFEDTSIGIAAAEAAGFGSLKLNCVVQRGVNDAEVLALAERFRGTPHVLRFIEYMDVGTCNGWAPERVLPSREVHARIAARWPLRPLSPAYRGEVAARHAYVDGAGEIGFVSSVSAPFCGDCHRARLSADGRLFTCLFASEGADLRPALAQGEQALQARIAALWSQRADRYSELRGALAQEPSESRPARRRIEMFFIGG
jgi:cyclic pyranopterin phosphate synthase